MEEYPKYKSRSRNTDGLPSIDNFFIPHGKILVVNQFKEKIERMFEIQLHFEDPVEDGQWLVLQGEQGDRRHAKNYISAIIQPDESQQVKFPDESCMEFTNPERLEQIEKQTNAFIKPLKNIAEFEISGTELAVTLALSMMEGIAGSIQQKSKPKEDISSDNRYLSPTFASERLNTSLQRALSDHSDGACNINEYSKASESVKRVLVECLEDDEIEDDLLFEDDDSRKDEIDLCDDIEMDIAGDNSDTKSNVNTAVSSVGQLVEKLTDTAISKKELTPALAKQHEYLTSLGATIGYKPEEVSEALNLVTDKTRPSDFLDILQKVSKKRKTEAENIKSDESDDDVIILETTTVDLTDGKYPVEIIVENADDGNTAGTSASDFTSYKRDLPDTYKERLLRDFLQEDPNCSVEELKRRNAERQKMLQQNFQQQQSSTFDSCRPKQQNSKKKVGPSVKPKGKNASSKKVKHDSKTSDTTKGNVHDQNCQPLASDNRYQNDSEQTCVMKPWAPEVPDDCSTTHVNNQNKINGTEERWTVAKRRKPPGPGSQTAPVAEKKVHKSLSQSPNRGYTDCRKAQGPPHSPRSQGVGGGKPVQIVSPTSFTVAAENRPLPSLLESQDPKDLKYIVIDGSNVAVTHGKGSFSSKGIQICVDYFKKRGHTGITVFLPRWRKQWDDHYLQQIQDEGILTLTPSRKIEGKLYASYDDRFILRLAEEEEGIIVSNDNFRDIMEERANWKRLVHNSLLMYCFAGDHFMPPEDPLGRDGPTLDQFLRKTRQQKDSMSKELQQYQRHGNLDLDGNNLHPGAAGSQGHFPPPPNHGAQTEFKGQRQGLRPNRHNVVDGQNTNFQRPQNQGHRWKGQGHFKGQIQAKHRSDSESEDLYGELKRIFPDEDQEETVKKILSNHPCETDLTRLTNYCMSVLFP